VLIPLGMALKTKFWYPTYSTGFTGVDIGLYAMSQSKNAKAYTDFDKFIYKPGNSN
jgi:xylan 1,4-beta-xylosidase